MSRWREGWMLWVGGALILVVNAIALGGVAYNRSEERARLVLTERELALPWQYGGESENSGLALQLQWRVGRGGDDLPIQDDPEGIVPDNDYGVCRARWLDAAKLAELGFDLPPRPAGVHEELRRGGGPIARTAWLLLELDGAAYRSELQAMQRWAERVHQSAMADPSAANSNAAADAEVRLQRMREHVTRLFVIDADAEPAALRARHPDPTRFLIARGLIRADWHEAAPNPRWCGRVESVDIEDVHVPRQHHATFAPLGPFQPHDGPPRYAVTLAYGRRYEPWIIAVGAPAPQ